MKPEDKVRIQHMIEGVEEALSFSSDVTENDFFKNRMLILSVIKDIEIIGEAASKISEETKSQFMQIPWKDIVGMRNRLIHGYFDVDINLVWNTIKYNLPSLLKNLSEIMQKE
jgi:uncharacterized protein with HEPN domain